MAVQKNWLFTFLLTILLTLAGCAPITEDAHPPTGSATGVGVGGALGLGTAAVLGASKPVLGIAALGGAGLGYYFTSLRFAAKGIVSAGGKVYTLGDYVTIEIPTDDLFDANTDEFLPGTRPVLDSIVSILQRYPNHNIIISASTSGFSMPRAEQKLSESRASQIAAYLWSQGIADGAAHFRDPRSNRPGRSLIYVGYGDALPIANNIHIDGIRANSRVQVVAAPCETRLHWDKCKKCFKPFENIGRLEPDSMTSTEVHPTQYAEAFPADPLPESNLKDEMPVTG